MEEIEKIQEQQLSEAKKSQEHFHFVQQTEGSGEKQAQKEMEKTTEELENDYKGQEEVQQS
jgi:hypothetical protein